MMKTYPLQLTSLSDEQKYKLKAMIVKAIIIKAKQGGTHVKMDSCNTN